MDSESAEPGEPAIPLEDGVTNVSFDTEFLASEAGLTFSEAEDTVEPTSEVFDLGFDITEESDFVFSEANGFTPLGGTIEHTGTVTFESGAGDVTVGDVSVSYDESRVSDTTSGLFVSNNVEGVIPEEAVLFDVGTFDGSILNIGKADLLIANEFADILQETGLASSDLTGADVGDISRSTFGLKLRARIGWVRSRPRKPFFARSRFGTEDSDPKADLGNQAVFRLPCFTAVQRSENLLGV